MSARGTDVAGAVQATLAVRVYYEDTDFSAVVYHASYLRFMERARTELLRNLGLSQGQLHQSGQSRGITFAVRQMTIDFHQPARMDDLLDVETRVTAVGAASVELSQRIRREGEILVSAHVKVAAISAGRAARLPADIRQKFRGN
jgi:acyl-CoA thioester hydrolase